MLKAKKYKSFEEMHRIVLMHLEAEETEVYQITLVIMLSWDGHVIPEIGRMTNIHPNTISKWIKIFNKNGIDSLLSLEKSEPCKECNSKSVNKQKTDIEDEIIKIFYTHPKQLGMCFDKWTMQKLAQYLVNTGKVERISAEKVRQILHKKRVNIKNAYFHITSKMIG